MAQGEAPAANLEPSLWKTLLSWVAAVLLALTFIWAGVGKITDPFGTAEGLSRTCTPADLSLALAILLGIGETYAGVLILVPRFRRWGAWLSGLLLVVFMAYVGANYQALRGEECGCFPWLERLFPWAKQTVKPAFFLRDAIMLALAVLAGWWARAAKNKRGAALVLGAVAVFGLACFGVLAARQTAVAAPESVTADGRPFPLRQGRVFLYFYDPECSYCDAAARLMAQYRWKDTTVISVATAQPQFAREFIQSTGLGGLISSDAELLRKTFSFKDPPYAVALEGGRQKAAFTRFDRHLAACWPWSLLERLGLGSFDRQEPETGLRRLAFID